MANPLASEREIFARFVIDTSQLSSANTPLHNMHDPNFGRLELFNSRYSTHHSVPPDFQIAPNPQPPVN